MPKFTAYFERRVVEYDLYSCEIEAETEAEANEKAEAMAVQFDSDCPEVEETVGTECESWFVDAVTAATEEA